MAIRDTDLLRLSPDAQRQIFRKVQADIAEKERRKTQPKPKKSKYNNVKTTRNGIKFDSKKEADRYDVLMLSMRSGDITNLHLQPHFTLQEAYKTETGETVKAIQYIADFSYRRNGVLVVEDVKSQATKTAQYKIKKKWLHAKFGITIQEV